MKLSSFIKLWAVMVTVTYTLIMAVMIFGWGLWPKNWWVVIAGYILIGAISQWPNIAIHKKCKVSR
jgi:hypothetical protein